MSAEEYHYTLYELPVISGIELPELARQEAPREDPGAEPALHIALGTAPDTLKDGAVAAEGLFEVNTTEMICSVPNVARFHIADGTRIVIEPDPAAEMGDVRTYLFGVGLAAALHQRGLVPLHISAVRTPYGVWAFTGDSGAGKSTLVGLIQKTTGWPILSDDVAVARYRDGRTEISAGLRRLKLWDDAVKKLGADQSKLTRDLARENKFHLKDPDLFLTDTMPLKALVQLERGAPLALKPLSGAMTFQTVMNAVYRPSFARVFGDPQVTATACSQFAGTLEGYAFQRPWDVARQDESVAFLCERIAAGGK